MDNEYLANNCNIGKKEKIKFYSIGILGTIVTVHLSLYFIISPYKWWMLIAIFIPCFFTSLAFLQALNSFRVTSQILLNSKNSITEENKRAKKFILISSIISLLWCIVTYILTN